MIGLGLIGSGIGDAVAADGTGIHREWLSDRTVRVELGHKKLCSEARLKADTPVTLRIGASAVDTPAAKGEIVVVDLFRLYEAIVSEPVGPWTLAANGAETKVPLGEAEKRRAARRLRQGALLEAQPPSRPEGRTEE